MSRRSSQVESRQRTLATAVANWQAVRWFAAAGGRATASPVGRLSRVVLTTSCLDSDICFPNTSHVHNRTQQHTARRRGGSLCCALNLHQARGEHREMDRPPVTSASLTRLSCQACWLLVPCGLPSQASLARTSTVHLCGLICCKCDDIRTVSMYTSTTTTLGAASASKFMRPRRNQISSSTCVKLQHSEGETLFLIFCPTGLEPRSTALFSFGVVRRAKLCGVPT